MVTCRGATRKAVWLHVHAPELYLARTEVHRAMDGRTRYAAQQSYLSSYIYKLLASCLWEGCWHLARVSFRTTGLLKLTCSSIGMRPAPPTSAAWLPATASSSMAAAASSARPATRWSHKNASAGAIRSVASLWAMQSVIQAGIVRGFWSRTVAMGGAASGRPGAAGGGSYSHRFGEAVHEWARPGTSGLPDQGRHIGGGMRLRIIAGAEQHVCVDAAHTKGARAWRRERWEASVVRLQGP